MKRGGIIVIILYLYLFVLLGWDNPNAPGVLNGYYFYIKNLKTKSTTWVKIEGDENTQYEHVNPASDTHYIYQVSGSYTSYHDSTEGFAAQTRKSDILFYDNRTVKPKREGVRF